ncbi:O-methyltransferase [Acidobacteriota bacterium]
MTFNRYKTSRILLFLSISLLTINGLSQHKNTFQDLDEKVQSFLKSHPWRNENIAASDGKVLYDLIIMNNYQSALEIGTSTGHSAIWLAWALSKTGGKLITIDINERRHKMALENFAKTGLAEFIDARLADAHELVPKLEGPFDFVFIDADKDWYTNYFKLLLPKLQTGGCFTAHNVVNLSYLRGVKTFLEYVRSLANIKTSINRASSSGISISYKESSN